MKEFELFMKEKEVILKYIKRIIETGNKEELIEYINKHDFIFATQK